MRIYYGQPEVYKKGNSLAGYIIKDPGSGIIQDFADFKLWLKVQLTCFSPKPGLMDFLATGNVVSYNPTDHSIEDIEQALKQLWYDRLPSSRQVSITWRLPGGDGHH